MEVNDILVKYSQVLGEIFFYSGYPPLKLFFRQLTSQTRKAIADKFLIIYGYFLPSIEEIDLFLKHIKYDYGYFSLIKDRSDNVDRRLLGVDMIINFDLSIYKHMRYKNMSINPIPTNSIQTFSSIHDMKENIPFDSYTKDYMRFVNQAEVKKNLIDIKSFYDIMKLRNSFMEIDNNWPIKSTEKHFADIVNELNIIPHLSLLDLYLMINAIILKITVPETIRKSYDYNLYKTYNDYIITTKHDRDNLIILIEKEINNFN